jgi:dGTPase
VQVVDAADSLTYGAHDADDALTLGLLEFDDLDELSLWAQAEHVVRERYAALSGPAMRRAVVRQLIDIEVGDLLEATASRLAAEQIHGVDDVRRAAQLVAPSAEVGERKAELDAFLLERVYRHPRVLAKRAMAQQALGESFAVLRDDPALMQRDGPRAAHANPVRAIADYLASLTDHSAWDEHARLTRDRSPGGR